MQPCIYTVPGELWDFSHVSDRLDRLDRHHNHRDHYKIIIIDQGLNLIDLLDHGYIDNYDMTVTLIMIDMHDYDVA